MTFLQGRRPRIIAHRGLALDAPENTLLAFLRALNAGATHLETDVHASADGVAVISHDPDLGRVAGRSVNVGQLTMPELRRVDLGHGQGFCSLAEALDAFPQARFNIDIKDEASAAPAAEAMVWTMLFSWMVALRTALSAAMEITAAGIDEAKVRPALSPK